MDGSPRMDCFAAPFCHIAMPQGGGHPHNQWRTVGNSEEPPAETVAIVALSVRAPLATATGEVMAPVIDDAARVLVRPLDDALVLADHVPIGAMPQACLQHDDHQPFGVDVQTDGVIP